MGCLELVVAGSLFRRFGILGLLHNHLRVNGIVCGRCDRAIEFLLDAFVEGEREAPEHDVHRRQLAYVVRRVHFREGPRGAVVVLFGLQLGLVGTGLGGRYQSFVGSALANRFLRLSLLLNFGGNHGELVVLVDQAVVCCLPLFSFRFFGLG